MSDAFPAVLGHDGVKSLLARVLREGRLPPALLFAGPEGVGKRTLALAAAQARLCESTPGAACGRCSSCARIARALLGLGDLRDKTEDERDPTLRNFRLHPDLLLAEPWKAGLKVDQVRQLVQELQVTPFEGRARVVVVDDAHLMNEQAQNALLKVLEEPPATSHIFLVSASPEGLLPTIRSRCQRLRLGPLPLGVLTTCLAERHGLSAEEARLRAGLAAGSLGAALDFASDEYRDRRERLLVLLETLPGSGAIERMEAADALVDEEGEAVFSTLRTLLRDVAALRMAPAKAPLNLDVADRLAALAGGPLGERAAALAERVAEVQEAVTRKNAYRPLAFDRLVDVLA